MFDSVFGFWTLDLGIWSLEFESWYLGFGFFVPKSFSFASTILAVHEQAFDFSL